MKYIRTNIYLLKEDIDEFKKLSQKHGCKFSELIRRALRKFLNDEK
jgi:metal-responsive CopG/Arc/MetJ family transcriptional regulator